MGVSVTVAEEHRDRFQDLLSHVSTKPG
jgi:hypothetical protein